jgi:hypothetical protein
MPNVGQELLNVPFPKMIFDMSMAIAKGQLALDKASINTVKILANTKFDYVPDVTEVLSPNPRTVNIGGGKTVVVTGVSVDVDVADSFPLTLLQAGITPTFYQFTESIIEVKMSISSKTEESSSLDVGVDVSASADFLFGSATVSSHVNYSTASKYSYSVDGSSLLRTTLKPVPPPHRMMPRFILVNAINPAQVTVTTSDS